MNKVSSKQELFQIIRAHQNEILSFGVKKVGVFGSFARNEVTEQSDVDFFIEFEIEKKNFKKLYRFKEFS